MTIGFLHTAEMHSSTFSRLLNDVAPGRPSVHVVDTSLLTDARERGGVDVELGRRLVSRLREAARTASVVVCTCSTISGAAERLSDAVGVPIVRIDRPMAERAVDAGSHIAVVTVHESTIAPTVTLIREVADQMGRTPTVDEVVLPEAWVLFEDSDFVGYASAIAAVVDSLDSVPDVVVLAQASMASAAELCTTTVPVLSSPRSAIEAAVSLV